MPPNLLPPPRERRSNLSSRFRQRMHPAVHALLGVGDVILGEPVLGLDPVDWIDRPQKVTLVSERHGGIDAHAAFEARIRRGPLLPTRGHAFCRHEGLATAAGNRIE